jgi:2,3-bisphosphoglycerate-dependent phosphoglycerate mutase
VDVLLIRHGESTNNVLWAGDSATFLAARSDDPPLTARGVEQADLLAAHLRATGERVDRLVCSPMLRAIQTAQPLAAALGVPVEVWVEVHEHGGMYVGNPHTGEGFAARPGLSRGAIAELLPDALVPDAVGDEGWWRAGAEEDDVFSARIGDALARLVDESARAADEDVIGVVTHGAFADALLRAALGVNGAAFFDHVNTGLTRLRLRESGRLDVLYVNRTPHLD